MKLEALMSRLEIQGQITTFRELEAEKVADESLLKQSFSRLVILGYQAFRQENRMILSTSLNDEMMRASRACIGEPTIQSRRTYGEHIDRHR
ncbi:MAG: hypothetical protein R2848_00115 [Thermomicrobiales bacterium]